MGTMSLMLISLGAYHVNYRLSCHTRVLEVQGQRIEANMLNIKTNQEAIKHLLKSVEAGEGHQKTIYSTAFGT